MKNECDIVKDLLFSYNDGILSDTSKELVEQHLKKCDRCKESLKEIKKDAEDKSKKNTKNNVKEIQYFKSVKKKINTKNVAILISIVLLIVVIIFNILVFKKYNEMPSTMEIYLQDDISSEQLENIKNKITEISGNIELNYISKETALEEFKNKFEDKSEFLEGFNNVKNPLHAYIEVKTNTGAQTTTIQTIVENIQNMPGIIHINTKMKNNPYEWFFQHP